MISPAQGRTYNDPNDEQAKQLLSSLLVANVGADAYRDAMFRLGQHLGDALKSKLDAQKRYCVVATVEDADFLAKGIISSLEGSVRKVYLTCFWNDRLKVNGASVAPIYNSYFESGFEQADGMIVVKSIMSGSCVVKTNISALFSKVDPETIFVVSPVMHSDSDKKLERQFPKSISALFKYVFLAKDNVVTESGEVIPGIGGSVYEKLGFSGQKHKNTIIPQIVRNKMLASL